MANIHVFADMDLIKGQYDANPMQTIDEAFGPVRTDLTGKYRLTSRFKFDQEVTAYAAFDGIAIIQDMDGFPGLVNLVLYHVGLGNRFPNPKMMIYRGLLREDFLTGTGVTSQLQVKNRPGFNSDLIVNVWDHFNDWKTTLTSVGQTTSLTVPPYDVFGYMDYDATALPTKRVPYTSGTQLSSIFNKSGVGENYRPFPVRKGWSIGRFSTYTQQAQIGGGIEIVLDGNKFDYTIGRLREFQNVVSVTPGTGPGNESLGTMNLRERILDYIDPAAFYNHYREEGVDYGSATLKGDLIYDKVVSKFHTQNRVYVQIRNQNDYSLNYYLDNMNQATNTDNFSIAFNSAPGTEVPSNYYKDFWPIYTTELSSATGDQNTILLAFRKELNPEPVVYVDQGISPVDPRYRFEYDDRPATDPWTKTFQYLTPNHPQLITQHGAGTKTSTAWMTRLYLIRPVLPVATLPSRVVPQNGYGDLVFGPVLPLSLDLTSGVTSTWYQGGRKRYLNGRDVFGKRADMMVITAHYEDASRVVFCAAILDIGQDDGSMRGFSIATPSTPAGKSLTASFAQSIDSFFGGNNIYMKYLSRIDPATIRDILAVAVKDATLLNFGLFTLTISRDEYNNRILPAANRLDGSAHQRWISIDNFVRFKDEDDIYHRKALLTVAGLDGTGTYRREVPDGGNIMLYAADRLTLITENATASADVKVIESDPKAYFPAASTTDPDNLIAFVEAVEEAYGDRDRDAADTLARIRHQYYGYHYFLHQRIDKGALDGQKLMEQGEIFAISVPNTTDIEDTIIAIDRVVNLYRTLSRAPFDPDKMDKGFVDRYQNAYDRLSSYADENSIRDNPSPIVIDPMPDGSPLQYRWDLGHATYGLVSLINNNAINSRYSSMFGITRSIDLSGAVADIGPCVAEYFLHQRDGKHPKSDDHFPSAPDLDREFEIQAPDADLISDAEAYGWYAAWQVVRDAANLAGVKFKFSDVLKHYYDPTVIHPEHFRHRWKLYCEANNFIDVNGNWVIQKPPLDGSGNFIISTPGHQVYSDFYDRIATFALFWCQIVKHEVKMWGYLRRGVDTIDRDEFIAVNNSKANHIYIIDRFLAKIQNWLSRE